MAENDKFILFSSPMVQAINADRKTQTRRAIKDQSIGDRFSHVTEDGSAHIEWEGVPCCGTGVWEVPEYCADVPCPYGKPGDRLLVKETFFAYGRWETRFSAKKGRDEWHFIDMTEECGLSYLYAADNPDRTLAKGRGTLLPGWHRRRAIFMPRRAIRIFLEVVSVRVERLNDISESDCWAEGIEEVMHLFDGESQAGMAKRLKACLEDAKPLYAHLWESINGAGSWDENPWVWVVEFKKIKEQNYV